MILKNSILICDKYRPRGPLRLTARLCAQRPTINLILAQFAPNPKIFGRHILLVAREIILKKTTPIFGTQK